MLEGVLHGLPARLPRKEHLRRPVPGIPIPQDRRFRWLWGDRPHPPLSWCCYCRLFGVPFGAAFASHVGQHEGRLLFLFFQKREAESGARSWRDRIAYAHGGHVGRLGPRRPDSPFGAAFVCPVGHHQGRLLFLILQRRVAESGARSWRDRILHAHGGHAGRLGPRRPDVLACGHHGPVWTVGWRVPLVTSSRWRLRRRVKEQQRAHSSLNRFSRRARLIGTACSCSTEQRTQVQALGSRGARSRDLQRLCSRLSAAAETARSTTVTNRTLAALRSGHTAADGDASAITRERTG